MSLATGLQRIILSVLDGNPSHREVHDLVILCQALSRVYLSRRTATRFLAERQGLDADDLAYDCIAELFRRDEDGVYVELRAYFLGFAVHDLSDEEVLFLLQRLVSSKTQQGLVRQFAEADPALAKILRNITGAIRSLKTFVESDRFGEPQIAPAFSDALEQLPMLDAGQLEDELLRRLEGDEFIPEALGKLARYLREQVEHCRRIPLMMAAQALRSVYEQKNRPRLEAHTGEPGDGKIDREIIVRDVVRAVTTMATERYVGKRKLTKELLAAYLSVIEEGLQKRYVEGDGEAFGLYNSLARHLPSLTREEYAAVHKSRLEYLQRLSYKAVAKAMAR